MSLSFFFFFSRRWGRHPPRPSSLWNRFTPAYFVRRRRRSSQRWGTKFVSSRRSGSPLRPWSSQSPLLLASQRAVFTSANKSRRFPTESDYSCTGSHDVSRQAIIHVLPHVRQARASTPAVRTSVCIAMRDDGQRPSLLRRRTISDPHCAILRPPSSSFAPSLSPCCRPVQYLLTRHSALVGSSSSYSPRPEVRGSQSPRHMACIALTLWLVWGDRIRAAHRSQSSSPRHRPGVELALSPSPSPVRGAVLRRICRPR